MIVKEIAYDPAKRHTHHTVRVYMSNEVTPPRFWMCLSQPDLECLAEGVVPGEIKLRAEQLVNWELQAQVKDAEKTGTR